MNKFGALLLAVCLLCLVLPINTFALGASEVSAALISKEQLVNENGEVIFTDALVESAIRALLGVPNEAITPKQLAGLGANWEELQINSTYPVIADLSVLQFCTKLKSLHLEMVTPADPRAISALTDLQSFFV